MTSGPGGQTTRVDEPTVAAAVLAQRLRSYVGNLVMAPLSASLVALLFALMVADVLVRPVLAAWLLVMGLTQALRAAVGVWHRRSPPGRWSEAVWLRRYRVCVVLNGLVWAAASQLPVAVNDPLVEALRAVLVVGVTAGGFALLTFDVPVALAFGLPALGSLCLHLWSLDGRLFTLLCWAGIGTLVYLSLAARRVNSVVRRHVVLQVLAQRQAEALQRSEHRLAEKSAALEATLDNINQGIANTDAQGRLVLMNRRARELLDLPETLDLTGADYHTVRGLQVARGDIPPEGYIDAHGRFQPLPDGRFNAPPVYVRRSRKGQLIEVRTRMVAAGGMVRTYTDVTEYVQTQQALTAARDLAEQASQAKSQFLSGMSHELRTPLNAIMGFGQVLLSDARQPLLPAHRRPVQEILNGAQHLLDLINDLLDLAIVERGKLQVVLAPVAVVPLLRDCLALLGPLAERAQVQLPADVDAVALPAAATVWADRTRLTQVLLNLLSNAIKYNRAGGEVRVVCTARPAGPDGPGERLRIAISDDGPGIDAVQRERLFEPFERLGAGSTAVEGVGLGLALSHRLVLAMSGQIGVDSAPGQGGNFWVELPRGADAPAPVAAPARPPVAAADRAGAATAPDTGLAPADTVLYIEDNAVNVLLMEAMLPLVCPARLAVAADGAEGLRQVQAVRPRLVLLDLELPDMHGFELLRRLRADPACRDIPVVAVTANAMPDDIARGLAAGFARYLTKPLSLPQLRAAVAGALGDPVPTQQHQPQAGAPHRD